MFIVASCPLGGASTASYWESKFSGDAKGERVGRTHQPHPTPKGQEKYSFFIVFASFVIPFALEESYQLTILYRNLAQLFEIRFET